MVEFSNGEIWMIALVLDVEEIEASKEAKRLCAHKAWQRLKVKGNYLLFKRIYFKTRFTKKTKQQKRAQKYTNFPVSCGHGESSGKSLTLSLSRYVVCVQRTLNGK
ncbi:hypothetical protein J6590_064894 [Homalodisca vitripennis]|nr:hypothetical protein J6590_064894 [Homalodisca vitripennis]